MIPRGKLDLNFQDIFVGIGYCLADLFPGGNKQPVFPKKRDQLVTLSVRTALDLLLTALNYPPGTEVLVSNINIPDMFNIIRAHQLVPIPLSVSRDSLSIDLEELESAINPASKLLLLSPLFGGIMDMEAIIGIAKKHQLMVIEDAAQAFMGDCPDHFPSWDTAHPGHPETDALLYSFGLIKTNTAISGALIKIKDPDLYIKIKQLNDGLSRQKTSVYLKKLFKVLFMKVLTINSCYTLFYHLITGLGKDFDEVLTGFTRGFPGNDPLKKIRFRPCLANHWLLERKWNHFSPSRIEDRKQLAEDLLSGLPEAQKIGFLNKNHSYWVLPIECDDPDGMIRELRKHGFDATAKASSLIKLAPIKPEHEQPSALNLKQLIYLPMDTQMKSSKRRQLRLLLQKKTD
ncbi:aminotransferase class I/II-fold pyridoxal phosphate-dependent enzyme [Pedobacter gandavensis]|uniref:Aminotransferase class I/II-fold pyridoxal phosphate-dependent enzyme n=1 Tax=Pedobacter gandavensis TaxID=2679963 RepID=A0ABR6EYS2_9SPHI|nr:aminotransferase class I/II-fold pyridoxal phosphate-dependent enzyme [Pedobacter gandavensis]MBB2150385.1 aminotransferase class I/II-fold pyridoxal phosphate-dependent enzyme [Pedobacter gandavensis]